MRPRVHHLAWLLVLLSSVSAAHAGVRSHTTTLSCTAHYARILLGEQPSSGFAAPVPDRLNLPVEKLDASAVHAALGTVWAVRPPAAHALALEAVTSLGR